MIKKYRKKPCVVEAMQFTDETKDMCFNFVTCNKYAYKDDDGNPCLAIQTLEGNMATVVGDWIIKGHSSKQGYHFWPVKPDYFMEHYEEVCNENM